MNGFQVRVILSGLLIAVWFAGCMAAAPRVQEKVPPAATTAPEPPAPESKTVLDVREERRLAKDLLRDVERYFGLLQEKNVEQAAMYVEAPQREAFQNRLWDLVARYKIQSVDVASYQLFPQADNLVTASVKVIRTMFPRDQVVPTKSELWMSWEHRDNRWVLRPQADQ